MLRALRSRNYRLFFGGQIISLIGTWMSTTAMSWLVYRLTGSALLLGVVGFAGQFPAFLFSPLAGITVDRVSRHKLLIATQVLSMVQSFALAYLVFSHRASIPWIVALAVFQGLVNAFEMPCRQSFVIELIEDKNDLINAIALNSSMFNAARLLGPAAGGVLIAAMGEGACFFIDGVSFLAVIGALLFVRVAQQPDAHKRTGNAFSALREGWAYMSGSVPMRSLIVLTALICLVGLPYSVLVPIYAGKILGGGPHTLGFLMAASGTGALLAALWLAARKSVLGLVGVIPWAAAVFGVALIAFAFSRTLWVSLVLLVIVGGAFMVQVGSSNTILQTIVDNDKRGRVMSFYIMAFLGTTPLGSLFAGALSERAGETATIVLGGVLCLAGAFWFYRRLAAIRSVIRPVYITLGILPPPPPID
jgi:MFS family permease